MTKLELVSEVADRSNLSESEVKTVLSVLTDVVIENVTKGELVKVGCLGTFRKILHKERRRVYEGKEYITPEHMVPKFRPSVVFKRALYDKEVDN